VIDYSKAGAHAEIVHALAIIESGENPALVGDGGQAYGLLQQHPGFFKQFYGRAIAFPASVTHTWVEAEIVAAASFFELYLGILGLDLAIQSYNLGVSAVQKGQRNPDYLSRFTAAYQLVRSGNHTCPVPLNPPLKLVGR
jgi:soluble lytic murein transglycosylase-like protein